MGLGFLKTLNSYWGILQAPENWVFEGVYFVSMISPSSFKFLQLVFSNESEQRDAV